MNQKGEIKTINEIATSISSGGLTSKLEKSAEEGAPIIKLKDINKLKSPYIYECKSYVNVKEGANKRVRIRG